MHGKQVKIVKLHKILSTSLFQKYIVKKYSLSDFYQAGCLFFITAMLILNTLTVFANENIPDRRKNQFSRTPAYLIAPLPYSYPGVGTGFILLGNFSNLYDTTTDLLALEIVGDTGGYIFQLDETPLIDERLFVKFYYENIDRAAVNNCNKRGMAGTGKNDFTILDINKSVTKSILFDITFFNRRLYFFCPIVKMNIQYKPFATTMAT